MLACKSIINQTNPVSAMTDVAGLAISTHIDGTVLATMLVALQPSKLEMMRSTVRRDWVELLSQPVAARTT
jgi:hypothetical protein